MLFYAPCHGLANDAERFVERIDRPTASSSVASFVQLFQPHPKSAVLINTTPLAASNTDQMKVSCTQNKCRFMPKCVEQEHSSKLSFATHRTAMPRCLASRSTPPKSPRRPLPRERRLPRNLGRFGYELFVSLKFPT